MEIKKIMHKSGQRPYVTLVDTGLAMAAQNLLAQIYLGKTDPDGEWGKPDEEWILAVANALARDLADRTF